MLKIRLVCAMASPLQRRLNSRDDALGRIAGQLVRVKRRINSLAAQKMAFSTLGMLVGAGGILVIAAFFLSTTHFLILGVALLVVLAVCLPVSIAQGLRHFAAFNRTAAIADQRAQLSCRLSTLLAMAPDEGKSPLWSF